MIFTIYFFVISEVHVYSFAARKNMHHKLGFASVITERHKHNNHVVGTHTNTLVYQWHISVSYELISEASTNGDYPSFINTFQMNISNRMCEYSIFYAHLNMWTRGTRHWTTNFPNLLNHSLPQTTVCRVVEADQPLTAKFKICLEA